MMYVDEDGRPRPGSPNDGPASPEADTEDRGPYITFIPNRSKRYEIAVILTEDRCVVTPAGWQSVILSSGDTVTFTINPEAVCEATFVKDGTFRIQKLPHPVLEDAVTRRQELDSVDPTEDGVLANPGLWVRRIHRLRRLLRDSL